MLLSTSYLDEAERCSHVVVLHEGKVLAQGAPAEVADAAGSNVSGRAARGARRAQLQARLLDDPAVIDAVPEGGRVRCIVAQGASGEAPTDVAVRPLPERDATETLHAIVGAGAPLLADRSLRRSSRASKTASWCCCGAPSRASRPRRCCSINRSRPGTAMRWSRFATWCGSSARSRPSTTSRFEVGRGEIFGLLGPNGAGKTTTFRMLCGLLPASGGTLRVAGVDLRLARAAARQRIGYVAQKFSLYGQLDRAREPGLLRQRLRLARRPQTPPASTGPGSSSSSQRSASSPSGQLPGGFKQRLAMAAALLHEPEILFLDEPTSGADPLARREFWRRITALAEQGVTVIVTTHFMEEAEYCDRIVIMDAGRVLAQGTPAEIRAPRPGRPDCRADDGGCVHRHRARRRAALPSMRTAGASHDRP